MPTASLPLRLSRLALLIGLLTAPAAQAQPQPKAPPPLVGVQKVERLALAPQSEYVGRLAVFDKVEVRARVKGVLGPRRFEDGSKIQEGQLLFTIDPAQYRIAVAQKRAVRDSAQAVLINAEAQLKRTAELMRSNNATQVVYDQRLSEQLQAKANLDDAEAQLQ